MSLDKRSIELGTEGWGVKEDNLLAFRKDRTRYVEKPFTFSRASEGTVVNSDGYIQYSGLGDELVTNGGFDTDSGWDKNNDATISDGRAYIVGDGSSFTHIDQDNVFTVGKTYKITLDAVINSGLGLKVQDGATDENFGFITTSGTYTFHGVANDSNFVIGRRTGGTAFDSYIDNVSVKEVEQETPRISYDIVDGVVSDKPHLLLEPARTNIVTYSENFESSFWQLGTNSTLSFVSDLNPSGTQGCYRLQNPASYSTYLASNSLGAINNDSVFSVYVKSNTGSNQNFGLYYTTSGSTITTFTATTEWQRFQINAPSGFNQIGINNENDAYSNDILIYGAQLEQGSYASSYIPNFGISNGVTRSAETANNCGASQDFNDDEGVLFAEIARGGNENNTYELLSLMDSTDTIRIGFGKQQNSTDWFIRAIIGNLDIGVNNYEFEEGFQKIAIKYKSGDSAVWLNGVEIDSDTTAFSTTLNISELKFNWTGSDYPFYGKVKELKVYPESLNDAELRLLTKYAPKDYDAAFTADYVDSYAEFTVLRTEATDKLYYSISDGANSVSGSATITATEVTISNIDISSLNDGTLTLSVYIEDERKQRGVTVTDTTIKDTTNTPLYSYALQQRATGATFEDLDNAESIIESLNVEV